MYDETFEDKQKFFEKIKNPTEFDKFKMILGTAACLNAKEIVIQDGPYKQYLTTTSYNPYSSKFESIMYGRNVIVPEGEYYEPINDIKLKEKRAKEIAEVITTQIGAQICKTCPLATNCELEADIKENTKTVHGSDIRVGTGFYLPLAKGVLDTNSL